MKYRTRSIAALAGLISACALQPLQADYPSQVLSHNPVGYWRFNETTAPPAGDAAVNSGSLGASATGYYQGTASHPVAGALTGRADTAAWYDGTAGSITAVPYLEAMNPSGAFTIEAWLQPAVALEGTALTAALSCGNFGDPRSGWLIYQSPTGWNFRMYNQAGLATSANITGGSAPTPFTWYHVVAVYDGANAFVYVNGQQAATAAVPSYVSGRSGKFYIGGRADNSFWWNGGADEVALYDKALTPAEIAAHYQNGTSSSPSTAYDQLVLQSGPIAYYRLNENQYTPPTSLPVAANLGSLGAGGDGAYEPGALPGAPGVNYSGFGPDNKSVAFNGLVGHVSTALQTLFEVPNFTMIGWFRSEGAQPDRTGLFGQNDVVENGWHSATQFGPWTANGGFPAANPALVSSGQWHFFAAVADGTTFKVILNGVEAASVPSSPVTFGSAAFNFNIGGGGILDATGNYFKGQIDEVAFFDKALTAQQLQGIYYAANIPPSITMQPAAPDRQLVEGNSYTLSVAAAGSPTIAYQWRKGGQDLAGKTAASLVLENLKIADSGLYDVVVSNPYGTVTSTAIQITVTEADSVPPTIQYVNGTRTLNGVRIWFSEPVDKVSAETLSNYQLSGGVTVSSAKLSAPVGTPGDNIVDLTTSAQTPGQTYTLTVSGVKDQTSPGNVIAAGSTKDFMAWALVSGYLRFEHYDNLPGAADADITSALSDPRVVAGTPTTEGYIVGRLDTRTIFPDDSHETYMARMTGWIVPAETAEYYFFLRSDDASRLYLSDTEAMPNPSVDTPIATESGCCGNFFEPGTDEATTLSPIRLEAGRRYGVLILLKEGGGGDWLMVAWRKSDDSTPATSLPYLPGQYFATYVDPNADIVFTTQPTDQPGLKPGSSVSMANVDFTANNGGYTVTNSAAEPPPGWAGPWVYMDGTWVAQGSADSCDGPYDSRLTSPAYLLAEDGAVTLTFNHRYSFEGDLWDAGMVRVSVNGSAFTNVAAANFTQNGYAIGNIQGSGIANGQRAFNGDSVGYGEGALITSKVLLGSFKKDDQVRVEFVAAWDDCSSGQLPSWVVKTVQLELTAGAKSSTFTAAATATRQGQPTSFTYQWQRNDGSGFVDIANATSASYTFFPTVADFNATFRVLAMVPGKSVPSNVVKLYEGSGAPPTIGIGTVQGKLVITYEGTLQSSPTANGPYQNVQGAQSPYEVPTPTGNQFFRSYR